MREVVWKEGSTRDLSGKRFKPNRIVQNLRADMNEIWVRHHRGDYSIEEVKEFYQLIGYSLYGYWEVFCFNNDERDSRRWTKEDEVVMDELGI